MITYTAPFDETQKLALAFQLRQDSINDAFTRAIRRAIPRASIMARLSPTEQAAVANQLSGMAEMVHALHQLAEPGSDLPPKDPFSDELWDHAAEEDTH